MNKRLLSALLLFCSVTTFAQSNAKKSSIFIGLGPSIPIGEFGAKDASDEKNGLATTGFYFDLGYQFQFSKNVGAIAIFKWKTHGIAKEALKYAIPDGSGGSLSINAGSWKMASVLGGITQTFALSKSENFKIEFREAAGVQFTSTPELDVNYNIPGVGSSSAKQESQSATSFAYLLGVGFKYQLNSTLGLRLYGDFNNSNANFKAFTVNSNGTTLTVPSSKQKTGNIDVGLGLTIGL
ncbi:hypothetical protein [Pedobacter heparinus]|uniref:hypothetical protein n=1 Tax=Pedobacter heparinus TaxID=984 RepID=UPI002930CD5B|nr:hypothetical protein [Pedobacter heparinus]